MIGAMLQERYSLDAELGRGGMGVVYRAHDTLLDRDVAVKVLAKTGLGSEGRARLLREARSAAQLNHPHIVSIYDAGEDQGVPYIVMELVEHETLFERKPDSLDQAISITRQICAALEHAHAQGIVHRDLKPENVIVCRDGTVKLTDFGLARSVASRVTTEGAVIGTVFYLPPEQALGKEIDGRADLYALGVMLYELTAGRLPFVADDPLAVISQHLHAPVIPPSAYNADIPPGLDEVIVRMLSKRPEDRPASAVEVRQALDNLTETGLAAQYPTYAPIDQLVRGRLVGREREFAEAKALWTQTVSASAERNVLLITGEPGVGKTPLVREIRALAEVSGGRALTGESYAQGSAPYAPIAQIIRAALPLLEVDLPDLVLAGLIALTPELRASYPDVPPNPPLDPQAEQQRLFESVVALCAALMDRIPLLLVVEDVQWADAGTLFLLRHLARRSRSTGRRLLIVLTYREAEMDVACCLDGVLIDLNRERLATRIKLARLDREQTRDLLAVMFQEEIADEFLDGIYRETEGNLFFIEEMCKALIEDGKLIREGRHWHRPDMRAVRLPQSVRLAIQSRVGRLPAGAQDVLRLAAVVGREFDFETLFKACELEEDALVDALEAAERAQLIGEVKRNGRETFAFAHGLTMTTLRESVSGLRRRRLHRRVATAITALRPEDFEALAYHYGQSGDEESALAYTLRAADRARQVYANEEAISLYGEALGLMPDDHPDRFHVLAARSQVYDIVARREEQRADAAAMVALAEKLDDDALRCDALIAQADIFLETEGFRARDPAERAAEIARALGDPVREGHALRRVGFDAWHRHDFSRSRDALEKAIQRFRDANLLGEAATCLHLLALTLGNLGETSAAQTAAEEALALSRRSGDRRQEATSLRRLAIVHMNAFEHTKALPLAEAALALHRELGDRSEECNALNVVGIIRAWVGRPEEAKRYLDRSLELGEEIGSGVGISIAVDNLMWVHFHYQGAYEAALAFVEGRLAEVRLADDAFLTWRLQESKAKALTLLGQFEQALQLAQALLPMLEDMVGKKTLADCLAHMGRMNAELGRFGKARKHLEMAFEQAQMTESTENLAGLLLNGAYVALLEGAGADLRGALAQAQRAIELLKDNHWKYDLVEAFNTVARLHLALDEAELALPYSSEAVRLAAKWPFESESVLFTHSRALRAAARETEADDYLRRAYERVMLVAGKTEDGSLRRSWTENIRVNREILAEWETRGMREKAGFS